MAAVIVLAAAGTASASQTDPAPAPGKAPASPAAPPAAKLPAAKKPEEKPAVKPGTAKAEKPPFWEKYLTKGLPLDEAIREAAARVKENPKSAGLHNDLGNVLARRGFAKEALAEYSNALQLDRTFYLADYNAGLVYEKEGHEEHAINAFRRAIRIKPGFPQPRFHLGLLYERQGRDRAAVEQYAKALRIDDSLRSPARNPLVVQTRLLYRVSLLNYPRDLASAAQAVDAQFAQPELFKRISLDRPVYAEEVAPAEEEEQAEVRPVAPTKWTPTASTAPQIVSKPARPAPFVPRPAPRPVPPRTQGQIPSSTAVKGVSPSAGGNTVPIQPRPAFIPPAAAPPPSSPPPQEEQPPQQEPPPPDPQEEPPPA